MHVASCNVVKTQLATWHLWISCRSSSDADCWSFCLRTWAPTGMGKSGQWALPPAPPRKFEKCYRVKEHLRSQFERPTGFESQPFWPRLIIYPPLENLTAPMSAEAKEAGFTNSSLTSAAVENIDRMAGTIFRIASAHVVTVTDECWSCSAGRRRNMSNSVLSVSPVFLSFFDKKAFYSELQLALVVNDAENIIVLKCLIPSLALHCTPLYPTGSRSGGDIVPPPPVAPPIIICMQAACSHAWSEPACRS